MTAIKQTSRAAGFGVSALAFLLACLWTAGFMGCPASARNDLPSLPSDTAEVYRRHAVELLFQHKDDPKGFEFYEKAIELASKDYGPHCSYLSDLYFEMASAEKEAGKFTLAEQHFNEALKIKPNAVNVRLQLASLYKQENKSKELYHQLQEIRTKDPATAQVQQALLTLYSQDKKRPDQAARAALVLHQMGAIKTQAIASAKASGWFNPFTTPAKSTTAMAAPATVAPHAAAISTPPAQSQQEETDSRALKLKAPDETATAIVTPATETSTHKQSTNENPTASKQEVSVSPLGVFSRMLSPNRAADRAEAAKKLRREQEQQQMAERERNRQRQERERQREELARRQSSQSQRSATRRGAQPAVAVAKPAQSKVDGPALRTTAKKINGKSGEAKPVEAKASEAKPLEAKESKPVIELMPREAAKEAPETASETPAPEAPKPKKKANRFNLVGVTPAKMPGELDRPGESNSENQPKAVKTPPPSSNLQRAMPRETMPPPMQEAPPPKQSKQSHPRPGLVPPPPPTMAYPQAFYNGGYPPPMIPAQMMVQPPMQQQQAPRRRAARREPPPEDDDKPAAAPASKNSDDSEFLIDWGGSKKKKSRSAE